MIYQAARGTQDIYANEISKWQYLEKLIQHICWLHNYQEIRTPIFENTNVFKRGNDASDMVNKEMYTFQLAQSKTSLTLRPEGTAGVVRAFVEHKLYSNPDLPLKLYYIGEQCRHERPQKGRMRVFHQFGVECIGSKTPLQDIETIALGITFLKRLGIQKIKVLINTLGDATSRSTYREALKVHFKEHIDTLCDDCKRRYIQNPLRLLDCKLDKENPIMKSAPKMQDYLSSESMCYFEEVLKGLDALSIPYEIDDRLVRGLDYYSDTVFEVISVHPNMGSQSTIFAGGRYDDLVAHFGGPQAMSGIGWAMGLERLLIACENEQIELIQEDQLEVYVLCLDENLGNEALKIATTLRANNIHCDLETRQRSFKAQFKTVERMRSKVVIIVGENEFNKGNVIIKRLQDQNQAEVSLENLVSIVKNFLKGASTYEKNT